MSDEMTRLRGVLAGMRIGPGRRYSAEVQLQIRAAANRRRREGARWKVIAEEIGIPHETIRRFSLQKALGRFVQVEVAPPTSSSTGIAVVTPNGYRVEGIGIADVADLLRRLS